MGLKIVKEFEYYTDKMHDKDFHDWFVAFITAKDDVYWKTPSSSTGKYHPPDEVKEWGQLLHCKRLCHLVDSVCRMNEENFEDTQFAYDILVAGSIIHDLYKAGLEGTEERTNKLHPQMIHYELTAIAKGYVVDNAIISNYLYVLAKVCLYHEGIWTLASVEPMPSSLRPFCEAMHDLDYFLSRRDMFDCMQVGWGVTKEEENPISLTMGN